MVVKVYISGISGNKEVKKRQQRVLMILDSKSIKYEIIDITEPGRESDKDFMQNNSKSNGATVSDPNPRSPLPPQIFNEEEYCGDYDQFDLANELDTLEQFLKLEVLPEASLPEDNKVNAVNGDATLSDKESKENSQERENVERVAEEPKPQEDNSAPKDDQADEEAKDEETSKESPEEDKDEDKREKTPEEAEKPPEEIESNVLKDVTTMSNTDVVTKENGSVSSRGASQEKEAEVKEKDSPSEALIQSEQAAAAE